MSGEVTSAGINIPAETEIVDRACSNLRSVLNAPTMNTGSDSPEGAIIRAVVPEIGSCWEALRELAGMLDPRQAAGVYLAQAGLVSSGITPDAARATQVGVSLTLGAGVTVPAGSRVSVAGNPGVVGSLLLPVVSTLAGVYQGTVVITVKGPVAVNAGTLTNIDTPVTGWTAVTNPLDGVRGSEAETDGDFNVRRILSTGGNGSNSLQSLRASLLDLDAVREAVIYENTTANTVLSFPPHSFEVVIDDNGELANDTVAQLIMDHVSGFSPCGGISGNATDTVSGSPVITPVPFTRATQIPIYVSVTVSGTGATATQIREKLAAMSTKMGADISRSRLSAAVYSVLTEEQEIVSLFLGTGPAPTGTGTIVILPRERATLDTSRITVTLT